MRPRLKKQLTHSYRARVKIETAPLSKLQTVFIVLIVVTTITQGLIAIMWPTIAKATDCVVTETITFKELAFTGSLVPSLAIKDSAEKTYVIHGVSKDDLSRLKSGKSYQVKVITYPFYVIMALDKLVIDIL